MPEKKETLARADAPRESSSGERTHIVLTEEEQAHLQRLLESTDGRLRERLQAVLMISTGHSRQQIVEEIGCSYSSLRRWLAAFRRDGVDGLRITWSPGRPHKIPRALLHEIFGWIEAGTSARSRERAHWTHAALAEKLYQTHGIEVNPRTIRNLCAAHGIRLTRPVRPLHAGGRQGLGTDLHPATRRTRRHV